MGVLDVVVAEPSIGGASERGGGFRPWSAPRPRRRSCPHLVSTWAGASPSAGLRSSSCALFGNEGSSPPPSLCEHPSQRLCPRVERVAHRRQCAQRRAAPSRGALGPSMGRHLQRAGARSRSAQSARQREAARRCCRKEHDFLRWRMKEDEALSSGRPIERPLGRGARAGEGIGGRSALRGIDRRPTCTSRRTYARADGGVAPISPCGVLLEHCVSKRAMTR